MLTMNSDERRELVADGYRYYCKAVLFHNDDDGETVRDTYVPSWQDAKMWCKVADSKLQDAAEQNADTFMTATYILDLQTDTWETYTLTPYYC